MLFPPIGHDFRQDRHLVAIAAKIEVVTSPADPTNVEDFPYGPVDPRDEGNHPAGPELLWNESYYLDFTADDGSIGGYVRVGRYPNLGVIWYWACIVGRDRKLVTVIDNAVPFPKSYESLEIRSDGLWADHHVPEPLERFTLGLEAFGVTLDDPGQTYHGLRGDPTALGFDLEWETDGTPFLWPAVVDRYEIPCRVHGEILIGDERIEFEGPGQRDHSWGVRDWWNPAWCWTAFRLDDGTRIHAVTILPASQYSVGYWQPPSGGVQVIEQFEAVPVLGADEIPTSADLVVNGLAFSVEPLGWSPVLLESPDGEFARFPRAMAQFSAADGRSGIGWIEFNQPPFRVPES
ncbi:MAG: hypothetical protein WCK41_10335 [Actinomycetes bacterium]